MMMPHLVAPSLARDEGSACWLQMWLRVGAFCVERQRSIAGFLLVVAIFKRWATIEKHVVRANPLVHIIIG